MIITSGGNSIKIAKALARQLKAVYSPLTISSFPDGDIYLKFNTALKGKTLVIVQSFQPHADQSLLRIFFAAKTAKDLGARKVILVAPYLAYMRQDTRFPPGEAISSRIMAEMLNKSVDKIITLDPHLHRYKSLKEIFTIPAVKITANEALAGYIQKHCTNEIIMGPDGESYQWAEDIARRIHIQATVLHKTRFSSRQVQVKMVTPIPIKGKNVVIVDDIISTGHTIAEAAKQAKKMGARSVTAIGVHGLLVENALLKLKKAGVNTVITTNCIEHPTNRIDITPLLLRELRKER